MSNTMKSSSSNYERVLSDEDLLIDVLKQGDELVIERYERLVEEYKLLRKKYIKILGKLQDRVEFERAKDIIRDRFNSTADEAVDHMKRIANNKNITIEEVAKMVLAVKDVL